jgi:hypothetical protein
LQITPSNGFLDSIWECHVPPPNEDNIHRFARSMHAWRVNEWVVAWKPGDALHQMSCPSTKFTFFLKKGV